MIESSLDELAKVVRGRVIGDGAGSFRGVGTDSRADLKGRLFVAIPGENHDGHDHLDAAKAAGASSALIESGFLERGGLPPEGLDIVVVSSIRPALGDGFDASGESKRCGDRHHRLIGEDHGAVDRRASPWSQRVGNREHPEFQ